MLRTAAIFVCHVLWFLRCLPSWVSFQFALRHPRCVQERLLFRLLRKNQSTAFGKRYDFASIRSPDDYAARVPPAEYGDFAGAIEDARRGAEYGLSVEKLLLLEPTSGSTGAPKLIPATAASRREFSAAVHAWLAWLYLAHSSLFLGRQYWAISPNTPPPCFGEPSVVPVGFADDAEYLGSDGRWFARNILAVPGDIRQVADPEAFAQLTLFFLLMEKGLRLISVWHPSFLTLLIDALPRHLPVVLSAMRTGVLPGGDVIGPELYKRLGRNVRKNVRRAAEIEACDLAAHPESIGRLWPKLAVISCWEGPRSEPWLGRLRTLFPQAVIQGKGLLATEGCVTLPTGSGKLRPCAIRSHYLEFLDVRTGVALPVENLKTGAEYSVVVTTGAGLWRYKLHDQVCVTGYCYATPCLEFAGKDRAVSDLVGEKLDERHAAEALATAAFASGIRPEFAMIVPDKAVETAATNYVLLLELPAVVFDRTDTAQRWADLVERELCRNYHYAHARRLGQLKPIRPLQVRKGLEAYQTYQRLRGVRSATVKVPALDHVCQAAWWS